MSSKKLLAAMAFGLAGSGLAAMAAMPTGALAADMSLKAPMMAAPVGYDWSGGYVGVNVGGAWSSHSITEYDSAGFALSNSSYQDSGIIGGGQGGYNWMMSPNWLLGLEADLSGSGIKYRRFRMFRHRVRDLSRQDWNPSLPCGAGSAMR